MAHLVYLLACLVACASSEMDLSKYTLTWSQDFTSMKTLSVSAWGPNTTWIAHTPYAGDWCHFQDPSGPFQPFNIGDGVLTIRAQAKGPNDYYAGLLASVDSKGNGFSQKWGYFEMKAKLPLGPGTWPAFWLLDQPHVANRSLNAMEIDIVEQYGEDIRALHTTLHMWNVQDSTKDWGLGTWATQCSMTTGFHTYGLDIQPDALTFYYDRQRIWQQPNTIPGYTETFDRPFYVLVNLAYGGGDSKNDPSYLLHGPQDMLVEYVKVWQGSGGSKNNSTASATSLTFETASNPPGNFKIIAGQSVNISGVSLTLTTTGDLQVVTSAGELVYHTSTKADCSNATACFAALQNDGNFLLNGPSGVFWAAGTWGNNEGSLTFQNIPPYLVVNDDKCNMMWHS